jgi:hypothetical protein
VDDSYDDWLIMRKVEFEVISIRSSSVYDCGTACILHLHALFPLF